MESSESNSSHPVLGRLSSFDCSIGTQGRLKIHQDPDYNEAAPPDTKRLKILERHARSELGEKVKVILSHQFDLELKRQQNEITQIDECIFSIQQKLQLLRYIAARLCYSSKNLMYGGNSLQLHQSLIHPAVKAHLSKRSIKRERSPQLDVTVNEDTTGSSNSQECVKTPRYIPPILPEKVVAAPVRGELHWIKKKLIIGNISRWIPISDRDDTASHKWMVYVRGRKEEPNLSCFVSEVVFYLHPSYAPHDVIHVTSHPFHVTRRGWGEFPLRIQVFFRHPLCKPVNVIHNLKLDRSYTGLQTLGAETVLDVMVCDETPLLRTSVADSGDCHASPTTTTTVPTDDIFQNSTDDKSEMCMDWDEIPLPTSSADLQDRHAFQTTKTVDSEDTIFRNSTTTVEISEGNVDCDGTHLSAIAAVPLHCTASSPSKAMKPADAVTRNSLSAPTFVTSEMGSSTTTIPSQISLHGVESVNNKFASCSFEKEADSLSSTDVDGDHSYHRKPQVTDTKNFRNVRGIPDVKFKPSLAVPPSEKCAPVSSLSGNSLSILSKPAVVRCLNKEGKVVNVPLFIKLNAPLCQGSLLRPPFNTKNPVPIPVDVIAPTNSKEIEAVSSESCNNNKLEMIRKEKMEIENKLIIERRRFNDMLDTICSARWRCVRDCVRVLARSLALVDLRAEDHIYRLVRPFSSSSLKEFNAWNVGKQKSAEWIRAKLIRQNLERCIFENNETTWSTKFVMLWCRRQGHAPLTCWPSLANTRNSADHVQSFSLSTLTEAATLALVRVADKETDVIVDVECVDEPTRIPSSSPCIRMATMQLEDSDADLTHFLAESVEKLGFKLGTDLHGDSFVSFSRLLLSQVWKTLADDLIRRSLRESWQRTRGTKTVEIVVGDIFHAITRRQEFEILTNFGLGSNTCL